MVENIMESQIVPYLGENPIVPEEISVRVSPELRQQVRNLVIEVQKIVDIRNKADEERVTGAQSRVQAGLHQIETMRVASKAPVLALEHAIDAAAQSVADELGQEKLRFTDLLRGAAAAEQARRDAEVREAYEAKRRRIEAEQAHLNELEDQKQKALIASRNAESLEEAATARATVKALQEAAADAKFELEMHRESVVIEPKFHGPLVKGGSSPENIEIEIVDEELFLSQPPDAILRLVKIEPKKQAIKDLVATLRKKNKNNPDFNVVDEFLKIGIRLKIYRDVRTKQSSRVVHE
jgi:hypothetical protein